MISHYRQPRFELKRSTVLSFEWLAGMNLGFVPVMLVLIVGVVAGKRLG